MYSLVFCSYHSNFILTNWKVTRQVMRKKEEEMVENFRPPCLNSTRLCSSFD